MAWRERLTEACATRIPGTAAEQWTLWSILLVALIVRAPFVDLPFMHDEISALIRLHPTLGETIRTGIMALDTHPPGVQVFEWLWTRVFGTAEWVVKLPFILLSVAALFLFYRFAAVWTNATVALVITALMATLQYFVLYGQLARPYAIGLFTTAWMADALTRYVAMNRKSTLVSFAAAAVLCAYTHHFVLLQAGLIGATGLVLVHRAQCRAYLIACVAALLLYLPNTSILLHQLSQGGLSEWLAPPGRYWLLDYAWWLAHCSWPMAGLIAGLLLYSIWNLWRNGLPQGPLLPMLLVWGLVPLIVGLAYSAWRAPVIQYSVLIFSFPFLLIAVLSGLPALRLKRQRPLVISLLVVSLFTLIFHRQHYSVLGHSKYEAFARAVRGRKPSDMVLIHAPPGIMEFYSSRFGYICDDNTYVDLRTTPQREVERMLRDHPGNSVVLGLTAIAPTEWTGLVQAWFPHTEGRGDLLEGSMQRFTRAFERSTRGDELVLTVHTSTARPGHVPTSGAWMIETSMPLVVDSARGDTLWSMAGMEFGLAVESPVNELIEGANDLIELEASVRTTDQNGLQLVAELISEDGQALYRSDHVEDHIMAADGTCRVRVTVKMSDFDTRGRNLVFKGYVWNKERADARVAGMTLVVRKGNGRIYGLLGPLK